MQSVSIEYSIRETRKIKTGKRETEANERHRKKQENKWIEYKTLLTTNATLDIFLFIKF